MGGMGGGGMPGGGMGFGGGGGGGMSAGMNFGNVIMLTHQATGQTLKSDGRPNRHGATTCHVQLEAATLLRA